MVYCVLLLKVKINVCVCVCVCVCASVERGHSLCDIMLVLIDK